MRGRGTKREKKRRRKKRGDEEKEGDFYHDLEKRGNIARGAA